MAAHSQDPILSFPAAESGRISGQAASSYILCERQRSPAAPCASYGGTPCWAVHLVFGCSALAHCSQCDSVVAFLCIVDAEGPLHVRQPVIHMPNVRGQGTRHLVTGTLDPLVGIVFFHTRIARGAIQYHPPM